MIMAQVALAVIMIAGAFCLVAFAGQLP